MDDHDAHNGDGLPLRPKLVVPEDVQEACAEWVSALYWQTKENPSVTPGLPTPTVASLLAPFRKHPV